MRPSPGSVAERSIARRAIDVLGLAVVALVASGLVFAALERAGLFEDAARGLGWAAGAAAALVAWRVTRARRRRRRAAAVEHDRAAGASLRLARPDEYRVLLAGATDPLAFTDADLYAGRYADAAPRAVARGERPSWALSDAQHGAVDDLTEELEGATLVRELGGSTVEVVGVKEYVGYRYVVDIAGNAELVISDDSHVSRSRRARRLAAAGFWLGLGGLGAAYASHPDGDAPWWFAPPVIGGFLLAVIGLAAERGPRSFADHGQAWHEYPPE